jgi:hypothetical protein
MMPTWAISLRTGNRLGTALEVFDDLGDGEIDAALQVHRVHAGGNGLHAFADDRLGENGGGGGAVTGDVVGLAKRLRAASARPCSRTCPSARFPWRR